MADPIDRDEASEGVRVKRGSWLRECQFNELPSGVITWTVFDRPRIPERDGDVRVELSERRRPEQLAREFYDSAELWWVIAVANDARLPLSDLVAGETVRIPDPEFVQRKIESEEGF